MREKTINELLSECGISLKPIDSETSLSENDLNGLHVVISWNDEKKILTIRSNLLAIDDFYDSRMQLFQKYVLQLNSLDFLPEGCRLGISMTDLAVQIRGSVKLDLNLEGEGEKIAHMIKAVIYFGHESIKMLVEEYERIME